ncbi:MAG: glycoside hydrolase N-terminal domain-containing protein [Prolixibacteraceae bacterium]|nr:glycoside hydrolase N-terminal domain-containing protein [Prolixibacteraceae bacterium]
MKLNLVTPSLLFIKKNQQKFTLPLLMFLILFMLSYKSNGQQNDKMVMWYDKPATLWNEALPVGNGRLGTMIYGTPASEKIQLNEETFWSGGPSNNDNPNALNALPEIRNLIFNGNYSAAESMINSNVTAKTLHGSKYQVIGNLNLAFTGHNSYTNYYRELNLENALSTTTYDVDRVTYKREVFSSQPDQVIVVRLSASEAEKLTFSAYFNGSLSKTNIAIDATTLEMTGLSSSHEGVTGQVKFTSRAKIINTGGTTTISSNRINVTNATEVVILISIATNFVDYKTLTANETEKCINYLAAAEPKNYTELLNNHTIAFQKYFNRVNFDIGSSNLSNYPTDVRIKNFSLTKDRDLVEMYYQFGRYLLISSSQPAGQPANLQGIWNESTSPSWDSKYTININAEMNYWPAEKTNLPEMHEPLIQMIKELSETGQNTASTMYGSDGWVAHHNTDIWRISGVVDGAFWGMWPMGGAWLSQHLWEKYLYSGDLEYLDSVYPILKSACEFYQDFLIEEPTNNWLVVSPSISPENAPSGRGTSIAAGTTMDNQILFDLFSRTIKAASLLNRDASLMTEFQGILEKLPPMQIGKYGQLQEWMEDLDNPNDKHRHVSHLYGLYPSDQISAYSSPELFNAAKTTLIQRGDASTGWSMGWKVNLWARLLDGNHAHKLITDQLTLVDPTVTGGESGGTYPNFFDAHPPFQIDGNFGCTSGITEMLMQSHDGNIHILPALPDEWKETGEISGLRAIGGFDVSFNWEDGIVKELVITSNLGGNCRLRVPNELALANGTFLTPAEGDNPNPYFETAQIKNPITSDAANNEVDLAATFLFDMETEVGETYTLVFAESPEFEYAEIENSTPDQIKVTISETLKEKNSFDGFTVKVNEQSVAIDSVVNGENAKQLVVYLNDSISNTDEVYIAYADGNVISTFEKPLLNFTDTLVNNLIDGAVPRILSLETSADGQTIIIGFNMKMVNPTNLDVFTLEADYNGIIPVAITQSSFAENDSTTLIFTVDEQLFADYQLFLSYSGNSVESATGGMLPIFSNEEVINNSPAMSFTIESAEISSDGESATVTFTKPLAFSLNREKYLILKINDKIVSDAKMTISGNVIQITFATPIRYGDVVTLSYTPGFIEAPDSGKLEAFTDFEFENPAIEPEWQLVPGKVEAENYFTQFGTQREVTDDEGGGENITSFDKDDWLEYAIDNTSENSDFEVKLRVAATGSGGSFSLYLDGVKELNTYFSGSGGLQTYKIVTKDLELTPGKHYIKIVANLGGFNFNYIELIDKNATGIDQFKTGSLKVYPNPASTEINIELTGLNFNRIEILDAQGTVVMDKLVNYETRLKLPVNLANGLYFIRVSDGEKYTMEKIIIRK